MPFKALTVIFLVSLAFLCLPFAQADDSSDASAASSAPADITVVKEGVPSASSTENEEQGLSIENARLAATLATAFDKLPNSIFDPSSAKVVWLLSGPFKKRELNYERFAVFMQLDGRTYAGVDFARQESSILTMHGFEIDTPESLSGNLRIKVVDKSSAATEYCFFSRAEIDQAAEKAIEELKGQPQK